jgi:metallo-beta-lactamase family protein
MKIEFHGAARQVTGSCHLLECAGKRVLIDCGLFQGGRELAEENAQAFGFDPGGVDYVLLTHAHLDHCGRLPLLAKRGFRGEIVCTAASRELARLVMLDAAHLNEEEAARAARHAHPHTGVAGQAPLYTIADALNVLDFFGRTAAYDEPLQVAPGITATFLDAGHILGSASVLIEAREPGLSRRIAFSGDIGNAGRPLLRAPTVPSNVDVVVMETTYGDRLHKPIAPSVQELYAAVGHTLEGGGNVIIPTFALERAQELLLYMKSGVESGQLPQHMPVFLDSPMAISATAIYERHPECYGAATGELFREGRDPFGVPGLHLVREAADSIALNRIQGGAVIIAGSGMCTGGRVRHHLRHNLGRHNCSVVFVGYAAQGTPARRIIDGASSISLFGEEIPVRAHVYTINGFSAHADQAELLRWHARTSAKRTFLVHGDPEVMRRFAAALHGTAVEMPEPHQAFAI